MWIKTTLLLFCFLSLPSLLLSQELQLHYHPQKVSRPVRQLVKKMAEENKVYSSAVGIVPRKAVQYQRFELLLERATLEELTKLCEHSNSCIRAYAFWGLAKKEYAQLENIFMAHAADTELLSFQQGCRGELLSVIDLMTWVVQPDMLDFECKKLDESALARMHTRREILMKAKND